MIDCGFSGWSKRTLRPLSPKVPCHRGDEACHTGGAAGGAVVGATDAVVLDGLKAEAEPKIWFVDLKEKKY